MSRTSTARLAPGDTAPALQLPAIDGRTFDVASLAGRPYLLSFFRFASCPFCNLRVHELVQRFSELGGRASIVAVFDSPLENLQRHAQRHAAPFPILADETGGAYRAYAIERSLSGTLMGMTRRAPTLLRAMARGYVPTSLKGSFITMPADFLIDEAGVVQTAYYGRDEGDHLAFDVAVRFSRGERIAQDALAATGGVR
ncbi:MAG: AhpC/TSA family protein [Sandaracinaceae bacterium]|nr:AhpC/TSA family protein [Sandaracinaceae bacterium]